MVVQAASQAEKAADLVMEPSRQATPEPEAKQQVTPELEAVCMNDADRKLFTELFSLVSAHLRIPEAEEHSPKTNEQRRTSGRSCVRCADLPGHGRGPGR